MRRSTRRPFSSENHCRGDQRRIGAGGMGVVFAAYLNGHQSHFRMVGGLESGRSTVHLAELFVLADRAGLLRDAELAVDRMRRVLSVFGGEQS